PDFAEHCSADIWSAVCSAVRQAMKTSQAEPAQVAGIGFDATCSLVALGAYQQPVSLSLDQDSRWDTIVWLDHRAIDEADRCTRSGHRVLDHLGGVMSPEMQIPKLM